MNEKLPGLFDCKVRPMTKDESKLFIHLTMMEMDFQRKGGEALRGIDKDLREKDVFPYMVMVKRLGVFKEHLSPTLDIGIAPQVWCSMISDRPAKIVMWAHTLNEIFVKTGRPVTLADWVQYFPMGIPTEEEYQRVWELQKITPPPGIIGDNMIDDFKQWSLPTGVAVTVETPAEPPAKPE